MKKYVKIAAIFDCDGNLTPTCIYWEDERKFEIDKVTDIRYAASLKSGGAGLRYTVKIFGQERFLFFEENRWFIECVI